MTVSFTNNVYATESFGWVETRNGKCAVCVNASSGPAASKPGETLVIDGHNYLVDGIGNAFRCGPRDRRVYVYIAAGLLN